MANKLMAIVQKVAELKKTIQEQGKIALKEAFQDFFTAHPEGRAIVWTQYTPYFNDGDECVFHVYDLNLKLNASLMAEDIQQFLGVNEDEDEDEDEDDESHALAFLPEGSRTYYNPYKDKGIPHRNLTSNEQSILDDFNKLSKAVHSIPEVLKLVLGDHCKVVANADGFSVDEYEHE